MEALGTAEHRRAAFGYAFMAGELMGDTAEDLAAGAAPQAVQGQQRRGRGLRRIDADEVGALRVLDLRLGGGNLATGASGDALEARWR